MGNMYYNLLLRWKAQDKPYWKPDIQLRLKEGERVSPAEIWGKSFYNIENIKYKGLKAWMWLVYFRNNQGGYCGRERKVEDIRGKGSSLYVGA